MPAQTGNLDSEWEVINDFAFLDYIRGAIADDLRALTQNDITVSRWESTVDGVPFSVEIDGPWLNITVGSGLPDTAPVVAFRVPRNWINEPGT